MKHAVIGILAHVDAGKTTLSESILYESGAIRTLGRVDNQDAFLDHLSLERSRGITIVSKQARFTFEDTQFTLMDTPGHVDFSPEAERVLQVLDAAVLVISADEGVRPHTRTLWKLLAHYQVPTFLFVNKMDRPGADRSLLLAELKKELDERVLDVTAWDHASETLDWLTEEQAEELALAEESMLEKHLAGECYMVDDIKRLLEMRACFPVSFGSALKQQGVAEFLRILCRLMPEKNYGKAFGGQVYKIQHDASKARWTHLKVTGGTLKVKDTVTINGGEATQKVNQIRLYSGEKFENVSEVEAGMVCAVSGLSDTKPGDGLGNQPAGSLPLLEPVLNYKLELPPEADQNAAWEILQQLQEEEPQLSIDRQPETGEIFVQLMGEVETEILQSLLEERYGFSVTFGTGSILYKETIRTPVEGVGHYEPLRHYAEVHILLEPTEPGSGVSFACDCSTDAFAKNWQRLVLAHLAERTHRGVLIGAPLTDVRMTVVAGRAHDKHTEGGDFRQATYRAIRQGLMEAECVLLEPWYRVRMELPTELVGRAMQDLERRKGRLKAPQTDGTRSILIGEAPVSAMRDYPREFISYTRGQGQLNLTLMGYAPCENAEEIIAQTKYQPQGDLEHSPDSVFCAHGAAIVVPWDRVPEYMHLPYVTEQEEHNVYAPPSMESAPQAPSEDLDVILQKVTRTGNQKKNLDMLKRRQNNRIDINFDEENTSPREEKKSNAKKKKTAGEKVLLVDGYNLIFDWDELRALAEENMDAARGRLEEMLCEYQGYTGETVIVVFDAYRVADHETEAKPYKNIYVVFTKTAETADQYIEKLSIEMKGKYQVMVATSDGVEQVIVRGQGAQIVTASGFYEKLVRMKQEIRKEHLSKGPSVRNYLIDNVSPDVAQYITSARLDEPKE